MLGWDPESLKNGFHLGFPSENLRESFKKLLFVFLPLIKFLGHGNSGCYTRIHQQKGRGRGGGGGSRGDKIFLKHGEVSVSFTSHTGKRA